jgi:hypothetical protein
MQHDKQCSSGKSLSTWLCVGACAAPAVTLFLFFPGSPWFSAALMLAVCGGAHFLMTRGTAAGEQSAVKQGEKGVPAPQAAGPAPESEVVASDDAARSPERQMRDAA